MTSPGRGSYGTSIFKNKEDRFATRPSTASAREIEPYVPPGIAELSTKGGKGYLGRSTSPRFTEPKVVTADAQPYVRPGIAEEVAKQKGKPSAAFRAHSPRFTD
eukprot:PhF_6_TR27862/c1_g1_i4/m.40732